MPAARRFVNTAQKRTKKVPRARRGRKEGFVLSGFFVGQGFRVKQILRHAPI